VEVSSLRCSLPVGWYRAVLALAILVAIALPAWAHAVLMESTPKANANVSGPELAINLRFNVRVDGGRSRLHLLDPDGAEVKLDAVKQSKPDTLQSHAAGLKPGSYKLQWQVLASDGHLSHGEIAFTVS
jgi:hypothetical protein